MFCNARHLVVAWTKRKPRTHTVSKIQPENSIARKLKISNYALIFKNFFKHFFFNLHLWTWCLWSDQQLRGYLKSLISQCSPGWGLGLPHSPVYVNTQPWPWSSVLPSVPWGCFTISTWHPAVSIKHNKCQAGAISLNPTAPVERHKPAGISCLLFNRGGWGPGKNACARELAPSRGLWLHIGITWEVLKVSMLVPSPFPPPSSSPTLFLLKPCEFTHAVQCQRLYKRWTTRSDVTLKFEVC